MQTLTPDRRGFLGSIVGLAGLACGLRDRRPRFRIAAAPGAVWAIWTSPGGELRVAFNGRPARDTGDAQAAAGWRRYSTGGNDQIRLRLPGRDLLEIDYCVWEWPVGTVTSRPLEWVELEPVKLTADPVNCVAGYGDNPQNLTREKRG